MAATESPKLITGNRFIQAVREALGLKAIGQRVIIDAQCNDIVRVYVQLVGDERLLNLDLTRLLDGAEVIQVKS